MGDSGYRGVSADQDGRYRNKEQALLKKLASSGQFPPQFEQKVLMTKVNLEVIKPWISDKVGELLGFEDDVVVEYVNGMLEDPDNKQPDPKKMQLSLTGFLESNTPKFMAELWSLLLSAQNSLGGIPQEFVEKKKQEMREARERDAQAIKGSGAVHDYRAEGPSRHGGGGDERNAGRGGRGRGGRCQDRGPRRDFMDKSGNRTERVQDRGWGARAGKEEEAPRRSDPYPPPRRAAYEEGRNGDRGAGRFYEDKRHYDDGYDGQPSARYSSRSRERGPGRDRRAGGGGGGGYYEDGGDARERSREALPTGRTGRDRSVTPDYGLRRGRPRSRSHSRSYSPPSKRGGSRLESYSSRQAPQRQNRYRSRSRSASLPARYRRSHSRSISRSRSRSSRSPPPRTYGRRRSLSRSYSPAPRRRSRGRSYSESLSPSRSPSPVRRGKGKKPPRSRSTSMSRSITPVDERRRQA